MDNLDSLNLCIETGVYSTNLKEIKNGLWSRPQEGTFADYFSMKAGDNVYFFIKRKIYGIGELINIGYDCKYLNYPKADIPVNYDFNTIKSKMLLNKDKQNLNNRYLCTFKASPNFFEMGIDMDDVLSSNPKSFRMLRAFWRLSFIKIDEEENKALRDIILKRNEKYIMKNNGVFPFYDKVHTAIQSKVNSDYKISSKEILKYCSDDDYIKHEMALEVSLIDILANTNHRIFGNWDYISHQVIASPFKHIDYMDKMDVFGYKYIPNFDTISQYILIEIKRNKATKDAINQIMKYVDWINQEYTFGDYSMIQAFLVCYEFPQDVIDYKNNICIRNFTKGRRPTISDTWTNVRLIKYFFDPKDRKLKFKEIK
ncbi:hypothetical protein [Crassaminicella profunda]|uniref:hypothetical protein n=1 Tax=Crassaminicella profunda TaxID=1286698 RepID=UPI001FE647D3|nr:hypothetical protein [Crassaminicella profunda]